MPVSSPYPPVDIPTVDLWSFLFERKDRPFPDDQVIYEDAETGRFHSFQTLKEAALDFGQGLKELYNWKKGDVLASFTANTIDFPVLLWGTLWAGGTISPTNPTYTVDELARQLKDCGAKLLATQVSTLPVALEAAQKAGMDTDQIILLGEERDANFRHLTSVRKHSLENRYRKARIAPAKDVAMLVYSSGTTGVPKGVMISHRNVVANVLQQVPEDAERLSWKGGPDGKGDRVLSFLPFFHIYGLTNLLTHALYKGYRLLVMTKFDIEKWCAHVQTHRVSFSYVVPPVVLLLAKHPAIDKYDLSSLRMVHSGAAPLTRQLVDAVVNRLKVGVKQGYGLTETTSTTHSQTWDEWQGAVGSVGKLVANMEAKYMTMPEDGSPPSEVAIGETGEIYLRGSNIFIGYHDNEAATRASISADGWFRTGDVGYQDARGNVFITDRAKELIKYKGFQVAPAELEGLLTNHQAIDDVAVIGVQQEGTEVPMACVVRSAKGKSLSKNEQDDATAIVRWLDSRVAPYKRLRGGVWFVDEIPRNPSGKILRRLLRDKFRIEGNQAVLAKL